jgi:hypothetical protein
MPPFSMVHYDKVLFLLEPSEVARSLARKRETGLSASSSAKGR